MVLRIDQQYCILKSQVSFCAPGRVCSDGNKRAIRPGLHPPRPTVRVDNDLLSWVSVCDAPGDRVGPVPASCAAGGTLVNSMVGPALLFWEWHPCAAKPR